MIVHPPLNADFFLMSTLYIVHIVLVFVFRAAVLTHHSSGTSGTRRQTGVITFTLHSKRSFTLTIPVVTFTFVYIFVPTIVLRNVKGLALLHYLN